MGVFQSPAEAELSDCVRAGTECRDLLLVRFRAHFPAFVEATIVGVTQGRTVEGPWPVVSGVGADPCCLPGIGSLWMNVLVCGVLCALVRARFRLRGTSLRARSQCGLRRLLRSAAAAAGSSPG